MSQVCYNVQRCKNRAQTQIHIWSWPEVAAGYFRFVVYVYSVAFSWVLNFICYTHTFSLNHPGEPFFKSRDLPEGRDPGFEKHCPSALTSGLKAW